MKLNCSHVKPNRVFSGVSQDAFSSRRWVPPQRACILSSLTLYSIRILGRSRLHAIMAMDHPHISSRWHLELLGRSDLSLCSCEAPRGQITPSNV
jgi:hypothetical protein